MEASQRQKIKKALEELARELEKEKIPLEICLYDGSVSVFSYLFQSTKQGARLTLFSWDGKGREGGLFPRKLRKIIDRIGDSLDLGPEWIHSGVREFFGSAEAVLVGKDSPLGGNSYLRVFRAKPEYLFVMKALSSRGDPSGREDGDMKKLIQTLGLSGVQDAMALVERYFPAKAIGMEVEPGLKAIFDAIGSGEDDRKG